MKDTHSFFAQIVSISTRIAFIFIIVIGKNWVVNYSVLLFYVTIFQKRCKIAPVIIQCIRNVKCVQEIQKKRRK